MPLARTASGGRRATTAAELGYVGLRLFIENGFETTTVADIAAAAGISRRTFFRYFSSKNDLPWGDFDALVDEFRRRLDAVPADVPMRRALREEILRFNDYPASELDSHRQRMQLLLNVPALVARSLLRFASWRTVVAEFVAARLGTDPLELWPQVIAWIYLSTSIAAYEEWLRHPERSLLDVIEEALDDLERQPTEWEG